MNDSHSRDRVGVIQIGVGGFGGAWVEAIRGSDRARCAGLVDVDPAALAPAAETLGLPAQRRFTDLEAAMGLDFDLAVVCIPPAARMDVYRRLVEAGKAVVCEKPLAESLADALAARGLADGAGAPFVVSQNYRYMDHNQELRDLLASGRFGRPVVAHVDFYRFPRLFGFREEMPHPLTVDMSIHHFDLARFLLDADPVAVTGESWNPPWTVFAGDAATSLTFEMTGGARLVCNASWTTLRPDERQTTWTGDWTIECEHGCVWMRGDAIRTAHFSLNETGHPEWEPTDEVEVRRRIPNSQRHVLHQALDHLAGGSPAPTAIDDNVKSLAMVFAAVEAFQQHRRVEVRSLLG